MGRDRLRPEGGGFITRRSGESFTRAQLDQIARDQPERLSPNVLLRPVVEAALLPTVAYVGGPAELEYLPMAAPLYQVVGGGVERQAPVPRWSGVLVEGGWTSCSRVTDWASRISRRHPVRSKPAWCASRCAAEDHGSLW